MFSIGNVFWIGLNVSVVAHFVGLKLSIYCLEAYFTALSPEIGISSNNMILLGVLGDHNSLRYHQKNQSSLKTLEMKSVEN